MNQSPRLSISLFSIGRENGEIVDVEWEAIVKFIGVIADEDRTVRYSDSEKREIRSQRSVSVLVLCSIGFSQIIE